MRLLLDTDLLLWAVPIVCSQKAITQLMAESLVR
jgi:hypothetical protein